MKEKNNDEYGEGHEYNRRRSDMSKKYIFLN